MSDNKTMTFLSPQNAMEAFEIANNLAQSTLLPQSMRGKPADIVVAMAYGAELGLQPLQSLQNIAVINGRPSLYGDAVRALVLNSHDLKSLKEWNEGDVFHCEIVRSTRSGGEITIHKSFGNAEATQAGLLGKTGPWKQYPDRMKQMRAFGFAARDAYSDRLRGFITREEAEDLPSIKDIDQGSQEKSRITGNDAIDMVLNDEPAKAIENTFSELSDLIDDLDDITMVKGMSGDIRADYEAGKVDADQSNELLSKLSVKRDELKAAAINSFDFNE